MVTIDPARDLDALASYVTSFVPDAHALGTADDDELARAASTFGVSYDVSTDASGEIEVAHTTLLYAVDDTGHVVLAWPFGVSIDDLAADIDQLLDRRACGRLLVRTAAGDRRGHGGRRRGGAVGGVRRRRRAERLPQRDRVGPARDRRADGDDRGRRLVRADRGRAAVTTSRSRATPGSRTCGSTPTVSCTRTVTRRPRTTTGHRSGTATCPPRPTRTPSPTGRSSATAVPGRGTTTAPTGWAANRRPTWSRRLTAADGRAAHGRRGADRDQPSSSRSSPHRRRGRRSPAA